MRGIIYLCGLQRWSFEQRGSDLRPAARDLPSSVISLIQWINEIISL